MEDERYAPPKARVEDIAPTGRSGPPLWNPRAAARLSLLFTPMLGMWVQMRNWQALGEPERAAGSRRWLATTAVLLLGLSALVKASPMLVFWVPVVGYTLLLAWYLAHGRLQVRLLALDPDTTYPPRPWKDPILFGLGAWAAWVLAMRALLT